VDVPAKTRASPFLFSTTTERRRLTRRRRRAGTEKASIATSNSSTTMPRVLFCRLFALLLATGFLLLQERTGVVAAAAASSSSSTAAGGGSGIHNNSRRKKPPPDDISRRVGGPPPRVVRITETEVYDGRTWRAPPSSYYDDKTSPSSTASPPPSSSSLLGRWTDAVSGRPCPPPNEYDVNDRKEGPSSQLDDDEDGDDYDYYEWTGDWKIVTAPHRDEFGWEYVFQNQIGNEKKTGAGASGATNRFGLPTRRRTWLRTCSLAAERKRMKAKRGTKEEDDDEEEQDDEEEVEEKSTTSEKKHEKKKKKSSKKQSAARKSGANFVTRSGAYRRVRDDFNFKGFGWTFYKSLVFGKSAGVALRVPLTYNFGTWESNPGLPSLSSSVALYGPSNPTVALFLSTSFRMEFLQWAVAAVYSSAMFALFWCAWTFLIQGLLVAASALMFPFTKKFPSLSGGRPLQNLRPECWSIGPQYSRTVEERIGFSLSWRYSVERGFEVRKSFWHYYAPTVVSLLGHFKTKNSKKLVDAGAASGGTSSDTAALQSQSRIPAWLVRRVAAVGLSTSGPIPDEPFLTSSALLSLSGFYFRREEKDAQQHQPSSQQQRQEKQRPMLPLSFLDSDDEEYEDEVEVDGDEISSSADEETNRDGNVTNKRRKAHIT